MAAIKRKGVIARPGNYKYSWGTETKTADDLKESVSYHPTIKLTLGHPEDGRTRREDFLGYVKPSWDEVQNALMGDFWFYEEHFHKIPENIRDKIANGEPWSISTGFTTDGKGKASVEQEDWNIQKGIFFDHVAVLREEDEPICPLGECGINIATVRQESEGALKMIYEQRTETGNETVNTTSSETPEPETQEPGASPDVAALVAKVEELESQLLSMKKSSEQEPEVVTTEIPVIEKEPVPELIIPEGVPVSDGVDINDRGVLSIKYQPKKSV